MARSEVPLRAGDETELTEQLTERQAKILDYIRRVTRERSYPPSVREIGENVGLSSSSTVHNHLNQLERRGLIKRDPSKSRTVQLVQDVNVDNQRRNAVSVPVIADCDTGYGGVANVRRAVREMESAGAAGLHRRGRGGIPVQELIRRWVVTG